MSADRTGKNVCRESTEPVAGQDQSKEQAKEGLMHAPRMTTEELNFEGRDSRRVTFHGVDEEGGK